ncbi:MAG: hypothetical protein KIT79_11750 [Deltaproteobacteria bacterium]|nr:hypothetical protein [Deltaproteobacteria bacterium]
MSIAVQIAIVLGFMAVAASFSRHKWLAKRHGAEIKKLADELLPDPYDPVALDLRMRVSTQDCCEEVPELEVQIGQMSSNTRDAGDQLRAGLITAGIEAAVIRTADVLHELSTVDGAYYEAMQRLSGTQLRTFGDLSQQIQGYEHSLWTGLSDAGLNKLKGHLAEVVVANHLVHAGLNVGWPESSNQTGWDLILHGHEVNVKLVADAHQLAGHFARFPDIPVVIPSDAVHVPASAFHLDAHASANDLLHYLSSGKDHLVIVDHSLTGAAVTEHAANATHAALGSPDIVDLHFPWITAVFSGWREFNLLDKGHTDLVTAVGNAGFDIGGVAIGGTAGGKIGAAIGTFIAPGVGTAIGGVLGGIFGAIGGRLLSENLKERPLRASLEEYEKARAGFGETAKRLNNEMQSTFDAEKARYQSDLTKLVNQHNSAIGQVVLDLQRWLHTCECPDDSVIIGLLAAGRNEIIQHQKEIAAQLTRTSILRRIFWPDRRILVFWKAISLCRERLKKLMSLTDLLRAKRQVFRSDIVSLFASFGVWRDQYLLSVKEHHTERIRRESELRQLIDEGRARISEARFKALDALSQLVTRLVEDMTRRLEPLQVDLAKRMEAVKIEGRKLGKEF